MARCFGSPQLLRVTINSIAAALLTAGFAVQALMVVVAEAFGMSLGPDAEPLALASELNSAEAAAAWSTLSGEHNLVVEDLSALCDLSLHTDLQLLCADRLLKQPGLMLVMVLGLLLPL